MSGRADDAFAEWKNLDRLNFRRALGDSERGEIAQLAHQLQDARAGPAGFIEHLALRVGQVAGTALLEKTYVAGNH